MKTHYILLGLWAALSVPADAAGGQREVAVRIYDYAGVPDNVLQQAKVEAQSLFQTIAIKTYWIDCPMRAGIEAQYPAYRKPVSPADVVLRIIPPSMNAHPGTSHSYGYVLSFQDGRFSTFVYILYDHVRRKVSQHKGMPESRLLAYVMVHEIGHLFMGHDRHSRRGIMAAFWRESDLEHIQSGSLGFTGGEVPLLQAGAAARVAFPQRP